MRSERRPDSSGAPTRICSATRPRPRAPAAPPAPAPRSPRSRPGRPRAAPAPRTPCRAAARRPSPRARPATAGPASERRPVNSHSSPSASATAALSSGCSHDGLSRASSCRPPASPTCPASSARRWKAYVGRLTSARHAPANTAAQSTLTPSHPHLRQRGAATAPGRPRRGAASPRSRPPSRPPSSAGLHLIDGPRHARGQHRMRD